MKICNDLVLGERLEGSRLKAGDLSIHAALDHSGAWLADVNRRGEILSAWPTKISQVPQDALPQQDVMLRPGTLPPSVPRQLVKPTPTPTSASSPVDIRSN